jgi:hypothetical protein
MTALTEGKLTFTFPNGWQVSKYDEWPFYRNQFIRCLDSRAVDFLALSPNSEILWLIEVKDYRLNQRTKTTELFDEVASKVKDTLAGLVAAKMDEAHTNQAFASSCLAARHLRVVLHLEQPAKPSKLFPRPYNPANLKDKLKQLVKPIDPHPMVTDMATRQSLSWTVRSS